MTYGLERKMWVFWTLYDFATTPVAFAINAMYLPLMIIEMGGTNTIVGILPLITGAIASIWTPVVGTVIDRSNNRQVVRKITVVVSTFIAGSSIIAMTIMGILFQILILFIIMSITIQTGWTAMNAYLAQEADKERIGTTSASGIVMGYLGGAIGAGSAIFAEHLFGRWAALTLIGLFLIIFGIASGTLIKERPRQGSGQSITTGIKKGVYAIAHSTSLKAYLLGSVLWGDGISTLITFASLIMTEVLKIDETRTLVILSIAVPSALLGAMIHGRLGDRVGLVRVQWLNIVLWSLGVSTVIMLGPLVPHVLVGIVAGIALGGNMSVTRAIYAKIIPQGQEGRLFGIATIFMFFGGAIGPLLTGIVADLPGLTLREALIVPLIFFIASFTTLRFIKTK